MSDKYIEENRGYITASKLKEFMKSPEQFFLKYIKEVPQLQEKEKKCFRIWTAIDDLISYWEIKFAEKYFADEWLLKWDLIDILSIDYSLDVLKKMKLDELKELKYWEINSKIKLTKQEYEDILGCVRELYRQPLFNKGWWYECQKTYIGKYKWLELKWTLDRDKKDEFRDTKSNWNIARFEWDWKEFWYDVSMAFYWVLKNRATWETPKAILDVVQSSFPYPSRIYELPQWDILDTVNTVIIPALDTLDVIMTAWKETGDENIWKVKPTNISRELHFKNLCSCDMYPIMESAIQKEVEILQ